MNRIQAAASCVVRRTIFALDRLQQRRHGVYEFDSDPLCIMRISRVVNRERHELSDGTVVAPGAAVIEIHFWNERMPRMSEVGPDMSWGIQFTGRFRTSLRYLARYMSARREYDDVVAVFGESSFAGNIGWEKYHSVFRCLGFDFFVCQPQTVPSRLARIFIHTYVWTLVWVLNPASLKGRMLRSAERGELWISRAGLLQKYGERSRNRGSAREPARSDCRTSQPVTASDSAASDRALAPRDPATGPHLHPAA